MNIIPLQNIGFSGRTKFLSCDEGGRYKKVAEYRYGSSSFGDTRGLQDFIKKYSYPYACVEETIGKFHDNITYQIYYADPKEIVGNAIKHSHDYIVYDNEPAFPDVKRNFYSPKYGNLDKEFQIIYDYYKRLKDTAVIKSDVDIATAKLMLADTCKKIFAETDDLRAEQEKLISDIQDMNKQIDQIKSCTKKFKNELAVKNITIPKHKKSLIAKENKLKLWINKRDSLLHKQNKTQADVQFIQEKIDKYTKSKNELEKKIQQYETKVIYWENYIKNAPQKIINCYNSISKMKEKLKDIELAIKPNYKKLCDFYIANGIKIAKRI